jgi:hypothetical protein
MSTLETVGLIIGIIGGGTAFLYPLVKKINKLFRTWGRFIVDWEGSDAEPGRDAVPGVMQRLNKLDGELSHNGGKSVKDVVNRLEKRQDKLEKKLEEAEITRSQNHIVLMEAIKKISTKSDKS